MRGATGMSGMTGTSTLPEIPAETRIREEAARKRFVHAGTLTKAQMSS
jgi:hypothetical protein